MKVVFVLPKQELENTFAKFLSKMKVAKIYLTVFSVISCEICLSGLLFQTCILWLTISHVIDVCYSPAQYIFFKRKKKNFRNFLLFESGFYRTLLGRLEVVQNRDEHALNFCRLL